jgi:hypothetical protein
MAGAIAEAVSSGLVSYRMTDQASASVETPLPIGRSTMSSGILSAHRYHRHIYDTVSPYLTARVWEIGSGYGQYSEMLLAEGRELLASDIDGDLLEKIKTSNCENPRFSGRRIDLYDRETIAGCAAWAPTSIVCLNVLEHIERDSECLRWIRECCPAGVTAVFLTPAFQALYGFMDKEAGHFRRYTRRTLSAAFTDAGWTIRRSFYVNPIGGLGWYVRNRLSPPASGDLNDPAVNRDIEVFDKYFLPVSRALEPLTSRVFGQSVVVVAQS